MIFGISEQVSRINTRGSLMKSFSLYETYIQLKIDLSMHSTNSSVQWLRFVFSSTGALYSSLKKRPWEMTRVIRIAGPANFR